MSGKSKEDPQPTHGDMRSAVRWIFLLPLGLMVQGMLSPARSIPAKQVYATKDVMFYFGPRFLRASVPAWMSDESSASRLHQHFEHLRKTLEVS